MAASKHGTLTAGVAIEVEVTHTGSGLWIINRTPELGELWATANGVAVAVAGDGTIHVSGARWLPPGRLTATTAGAVIVRLIAAAAIQWSVEAGPRDQLCG